MSKSSFIKTSALLLVIATCVVAGSAYLQMQGKIEATSFASSATPALAAGAASGYDAPGVPVRLEIPSIKLDAKVQPVGLAKDGVALGTPSNCVDAAWYKLGVRPGEPGSAVMDGHLDCKTMPEAVFYSIGDLQKGDLIKVTDAAGSVRTFRVTGVKTYDYADDASVVFHSGDGSHLNLITCAGTWMKDKHLYDQRVVVFSDLVRS